jgi:hypothetical protein
MAARPAPVALNLAGHRVIGDGANAIGCMGGERHAPCNRLAVQPVINRTAPPAPGTCVPVSGVITAHRPARRRDRRTVPVASRPA